MKTFIPSTKEMIINLDNYKRIEPFNYGYGKNERIEIHIYFPDKISAVQLHYNSKEERDADFNRIIELIK